MAKFSTKDFFVGPFKTSYKLRLLADEAWSQGNKDLSTELHSVARCEEKRELEKRNNGS